ncbi:MAG TPA: PRC-barrel domain-containing protein [Woeseiaceae bacterium]|nr:PRC-barrel domain-containing protein [Woeseiaceae bacterium]
MRKLKRNTSIVSAAATVIALVSGGIALAQDTGAYDNKAMDADKPKSAMQHDSAKADNKQEVLRLQSNFGVEELNDIEDWEIVNNGQELGSIDRLGIDRATGEILAVVGLEGVVGVNMKEVAIPLKDLTKAGDESLSTMLSKEQLQKKRDIDPWDGTYSQIVNDAISQ